MKKKPNGYWTFERLKIETLKYETIKSFREHEYGAYSKIIYNKWQKDLFSHFKTASNDSKRCIYSFEFSDNYVYIGLTNNFNIRKKRHFYDENSQVFKHILQTNITPIITQLTDYLDIDTAKEKEDYYVNYYKNDNWNILNVAKTGGLGGSGIYWIFEKVDIEAKKYKKRIDFSINSPGAYNSAKKNKWLDIVCKHMKTKKQKPKNYWTKERCQKEALRYDNRSSFEKNSLSAYDKSLRKKWLDEICTHMTPLKKPNGYWTKERCYEESKKYKNRSSFEKYSISAYIKSRKNKWLDDFFSSTTQQKNI